MEKVLKQPQVWQRIVLVTELEPLNVPNVQCHLIESPILINTKMFISMLNMFVVFAKRVCNQDMRIEVICVRQSFLNNVGEIRKKII